MRSQDVTVNLEKTMTQKSENQTARLSELIERQQMALELSDKDIADALGFQGTNVIELIRSGQMKLPMNKACALGQVLEVEPGDVMTLLLRDTSPDLLKVIEECMGPLSLTAGEKRLLMAMRAAAGSRAVSPLFIEGAAVAAVVVW